MQLKKTKSKSAGFTLIELLIVIIIIGILAAIAFVAYSGSQNKAHKADAQSTLSQSRSKLAEYNSDQGDYPADKTAFVTWLKSADGGNNKSLGDKLGDAGYDYACTATNDCSGYTLTAKGTLFGGATPADDIKVTN